MTETMKTITITCENTGRDYHVAPGTTVGELQQIIHPENRYPVMGALVNNQLQDLQYVIMAPSRINYVDMTSLDGYSVNTRSLIFVLYKAVTQLYPRRLLRVEYFLSNGIYCRISNPDTKLTAEIIDRLREEMRQIIAADYPITRENIPTEKVVQLFRKKGLKDKTDLLETRGKLYSSLYYIDKLPDYFYGTLCPSTGCLQTFGLIPYKGGMLLQLPDRHNPSELRPFIRQDKLFQVFNEHKEWAKILEVSDIGSLNKLTESKRDNPVIKISEALHEKKISQIADQIKSRRKKVKVILIAGPSSSGKTTFSKRLAVQLAVNGIRPVNLSLDNYFVNREDTPLDEKGEYDYETIDALDIATFTDNIRHLLAGEEVEIPKFSFEAGKRYYDGEKLRIAPNNVIIVEGIHGLNPKLTQLLPPDALFKIFVSALTATTSSTRPTTA
jgi:uridine kinase